MNCFTILYAVTIGCFMIEVQSKTIEMDLSNVIDKIQDQLLQKQGKLPSDDEETDGSIEISEEKRGHALGNRDLIELLKRVVRNDDNNGENIVIDKNNKKQRVKNFLKQTVSDDTNENDKELQYEYKKEMFRPKSLTSSLLDDVNESMDDNAKKGILDNLSGYSKIYLILQPRALNQSKNMNTISKLLSNLLKSFTNSERNKENKKKRRYKGFVVKNTPIEEHNTHNYGQASSFLFRKPVADNR